MSDNLQLWVSSQTPLLLDLAVRSACDEGGFGWLDSAGNIDRTQPRFLWITCRMTHACAIGTLLGHPGCREAMDHGVQALTGLFHDDQFGGWYTSVDWDGTIDDSKAAYPHAFVILAASSAAAAGSVPARDLLKEALNTSTAHFWDEEYSMAVEEWDREFSHLDPYRGANANMHTVEAYMAAADVLDQLGEPSGDDWRERALAIADRLINKEARANGWRIPEHFDTSWNRILNFNSDHPADPFRPYGATVGHGLEWARLCLQLDAGLAQSPAWLREAAPALYDRALADGWDADGADGFIYTTDWDGTPVVHERMHWVVAEAIGASSALTTAGIRDTSSDIARWWDYAKTYLVDPESGAWHHELDRFNKPSSTVWSGAPDVYHALQATLIPTLPLSPSIVPALAQRASISNA